MKLKDTSRWGLLSTKTKLYERWCKFIEYVLYPIARIYRVNRTELDGLPIWFAGMIYRHGNRMMAKWIEDIERKGLRNKLSVDHIREIDEARNYLDWLATQLMDCGIRPEYYL